VPPPETPGDGADVDAFPDQFGRREVVERLERGVDLQALRDPGEPLGHRLRQVWRLAVRCLGEDERVARQLDAQHARNPFGAIAKVGEYCDRLNVECDHPDLMLFGVLLPVFGTILADRPTDMQRPLTCCFNTIVRTVLGVADMQVFPAQRTHFPAPSSGYHRQPHERAEAPPPCFIDECRGLLGRGRLRVRRRSLRRLGQQNRVEADPFVTDRTLVSTADDEMNLANRCFTERFADVSLASTGAFVLTSRVMHDCRRTRTVVTASSQLGVERIEVVSARCADGQFS
jgi:hypothetical protein